MPTGCLPGIALNRYPARGPLWPVLADQISRSAVSFIHFFFCAQLVDTLDSLQTVIVSRFLVNLRRTQQQPPVPSRPSGIRTSRFRIPSIPDIVGDMGQPLDHGMYERGVAAGANVQEDAVVTGSSFVQGSSTSAAPATRAAQRGVEGERSSTVSCLCCVTPHGAYVVALNRIGQLYVKCFHTMRRRQVL